MSFLKKAQQTVAHTSKLPALGNRDLKLLQDVITTEKNFIQSNTKAATDFKKNAQAFKAWSAEEGADLNDVLAKISLLYDHYSASQNRLNSHLATVRLHFKSIRTREEALAQLKASKRSLGSDIDKVEKKLAKMGPENKELMKVTSQLKEMRHEMQGLHIEVMNEEAAIGDFKRRTTKEALGIKSGALLEMAEKLTIIAEISKLMLKEIPLQPTRPGHLRAEYYGFAKTESLLQEATRSIADVGFNPTGPSAGIPRFGDMTLADDTANGSRDIAHPYPDQDGQYTHDNPHDNPHADYAAADTGYSPQPNAEQYGTEDATKTPIYAAHASRSQWAQEAAAAAAAAAAATEDPATNEWAQSSYDRGDHSTASASAAGADLNSVPGHGDPNHPDEGFLMQTGHPQQQQQYNSNRNSADYQSAQGSHAMGVTPSTSGQVPAAMSKPMSTEGHTSDAYDGISAEPNPSATAMLGAPTLPPVRTATPLNGDTSAAAPQTAAPAIATTYAATDDSAYFQSIGSTRAMQEAMRRPTSPPGNQARAVSYGALSPSQTGAEGKKVTAAAFRRGFSRQSSAQAGMSLPPGAGAGYDEAADRYGNALPAPPAINPHANLTTPTPPGGYIVGGGGATSDGDHSVAPLHINKRNSNSHQQPPQLGMRYSNDLHVQGQDNPAPPYGGGDGSSSVDYATHQPAFPPSQMAPPLQQHQHNSQYAEYAAPPPPGYGYA